MAPVVRALERRQRVRRHEVVELRELRAAAAQLPLEAVDRPEVEGALGAGRPVVFWAVGALRGVARRRRRRRRRRVVMRWVYARALYKDPAASLDDLREAMTTLEDTERVAKRVLGGAHPDVAGIRNSLRLSREVLDARETPSGNA